MLKQRKDSTFAESYIEHKVGLKRTIYIFILISGMLVVFTHLSAQIRPDVPLTLIIEDIYSFLSETDNQIDFEELSTDLIELAEHPININTATEADLQRLRFLSPQQIDDILLYVYRQPMHSLYELQLIPSLHTYEIRDLLPFLTAEAPNSEKPFYWKEIFQLATHEIDLRADLRNIETNLPDPFYTSLKYKFNYQNRIQFGLTADHDVSEPWWVNPRKKDHTAQSLPLYGGVGGGCYGYDFYSAYLQIQDLKHLQKLVVGDFRASFGQGLTLNTNRRFGGKTSMVMSAGTPAEGLTRYASTSEADFFRGAGATIDCTHGFTLSAFYSARKIDGHVKNGVFPSIQTTGYHRTEHELAGKRAIWQQVAGANLTWKYKHWKIGLTATENILSDTLRPQPNYYNANHFQGTRQFAAGLNYFYHNQRVSLFGELATAQNTRWGYAALTGVRFYPVSDIGLVTIYRYFSPTFDNMLANAFSEDSRNNDENGLYLGAEIKRVPKWRFAAYADAFRFAFPKYGIKTPSVGYDAFLQANFYPQTNLQMGWKLRAKQKGSKSKYQLRYNLRWAENNWQINTLLEGNLASSSELQNFRTSKPSAKLTYGLALSQDLAYTFSQVPITLQARLSAFHIRDYDNRIYFYENDVLYAYSIPALYGLGGRFYLNARYKINSHVALYLKAAHTVFADEWVQQQDLPTNRRTDIHCLLRLKF